MLKLVGDNLKRTKHLYSLKYFPIDIYTLICIKWINNKNLLYKKINKIRFKDKKN